MKTKIKYTTKIIGDGKTPETAFRPYLPIKGLECVVIEDSIDGKMLVEVNAEKKDHNKIKSEKDIKEK